MAAPCLHSKDRPAPGSRGRDQLRQAAFSPKANTRVAKRLGFHEVKANLVGDSGPPRDGCEPRWARPCEASGALLLSNGGSGGGHETCTLWPPPAPFGYFPARGKYLVRPQAGETSHKKHIPCEGQGKEPFLLFPFCRVSHLRVRPGGFPIAPWTPSGPIPIYVGETSHKEHVSCEGQGKVSSLPSFFAGNFASAEATKGLSDRPLETFGGHPC